MARAPYSAAELRADAAIHALGVGFAIGAAAWLWSHASGLALVVYGLGLVATLTASAAYNLHHGAYKEWLRRIDHAMIFIMIAGTYTPFVVLRLPAGPALWLGGLVWCGAILGVVLKLLFPRRFERMSLALYLGLGWAVVAAFDPLMGAVARSTFDLLVLGGILYTAGVPLCLMERLPFHNALWHAFVLAGAICHFIAVSSEFA